MPHAQESRSEKRLAQGARAVRVERDPAPCLVLFHSLLALWPTVPKSAVTSVPGGGFETDLMLPVESGRPLVIKVSCQPCPRAWDYPISTAGTLPGNQLHSQQTSVLGPRPCSQVPLSAGAFRWRQK